MQFFYKIKRFLINEAILEHEIERYTGKQIKRLIKVRNFDEAIKLTQKYPENPKIQSQRMAIAIQRGDFEQAKKIGRKFTDDAIILSQMITIAIKEGDLEEAKKIFKRFKNSISNDAGGNERKKI